MIIAVAESGDIIIYIKCIVLYIFIYFVYIPRVLTSPPGFCANLNFSQFALPLI